MKGKPWTVEEERKLAELFKPGVGLKKLMNIFGKSENAVRKKARRVGLRLEEGGGLKINPPSYSSFVIDSSGELRSIEEALKLLNGALDTLQKGGLDKTENSASSNHHSRRMRSKENITSYQKLPKPTKKSAVWQKQDLVT